jgi:hypothetical protein
MKKLILGLVAASAVAVAAPGLASAGGPSDNPTPSDKTGFNIANHIHNFNTAEYSSDDVDHNGVGWLFSEWTGEQISGGAGVRTEYVPQEGYEPISNNG